jgi:hypothetical protein
MALWASGRPLIAGRGITDHLTDVLEIEYRNGAVVKWMHFPKKNIMLKLLVKFVKIIIEKRRGNAGCNLCFLGVRC